MRPASDGELVTQVVATRRKDPPRCRVSSQHVASVTFAHTTTRFSQHEPRAEVVPRCEPGGREVNPRIELAARDPT